MPSTVYHHVNTKHINHRLSWQLYSAADYWLSTPLLSPYLPATSPLYHTPLYQPTLYIAYCLLLTAARQLPPGASTPPARPRPRPPACLTARRPAPAARQPSHAVLACRACCAGLVCLLSSAVRCLCSCSVAVCLHPPRIQYTSVFI